MTDNEIIKALECCKSVGNCANCPLDPTQGQCVTKIITGSLDLINRLKAENERLNGNLKFVRGTIERQKAEIERLKEKDDNWATSYANAVARAVGAKSEAYKEFVTKAEEKAQNAQTWTGIEPVVTVLDLNNLLKEMG